MGLYFAWGRLPQAPDFCGKRAPVTLYVFFPTTGGRGPHSFRMQVLTHFEGLQKNMLKTHIPERGVYISYIKWFGSNTETPYGLQCIYIIMHRYLHKGRLPHQCLWHHHPCRADALTACFFIFCVFLIFLVCFFLLVVVCVFVFTLFLFPLANVQSLLALFSHKLICAFLPREGISRLTAHV